MKIKEVGEEKDRDRRSNRGGGKERNGRGGRDGGIRRVRRVDGRGGSWLINIQNSRTRGLGFEADSPAVAAQDPQDSRRFEVVKTSRFAVHKVDARGIGTSRICLEDSEDSRCGIQALGGLARPRFTTRDSRLAAQDRGIGQSTRPESLLGLRFLGFLSLSVSLCIFILSLLFSFSFRWPFLFILFVCIVCVGCLSFYLYLVFRTSLFVVCTCACVCARSCVCIYLPRNIFLSTSKHIPASPTPRVRIRKGVRRVMATPLWACKC